MTIDELEILAVRIANAGMAALSDFDYQALARHAEANWSCSANTLVNLAITQAFTGNTAQ